MFSNVQRKSIKFRTELRMKHIMFIHAAGHVTTKLEFCIKPIAILYFTPEWCKKMYQIQQSRKAILGLLNF